MTTKWRDRWAGKPKAAPVVAAPATAAAPGPTLSVTEAAKRALEVDPMIRRHQALYGKKP